jgi:hypothetical protein
MTEETQALEQIEQQAQALPGDTLAQVEQVAQEIADEAKALMPQAAPADPEPKAPAGDVAEGRSPAHDALDQIDALAGKVQAYADQGHAMLVTRQLRDLVAQARAAL